MASFDQHIAQAKCNLDFLEKINAIGDNFIDWQVTTNFYIVVHLVNAFLAKESNLHYASHDLVKEAISPFGRLPNTRLKEPEFLAYVHLRNLSRRSRYLLFQEDPKTNIDKAHYILEKHFMKSFEYLDNLIIYFSGKYSLNFRTLTINYDYQIPPPSLVNFKFSKRKS
jgi:hypothetical protein